MARRTLLDFFGDLAQIGGDFVVYDDGYRVRRFTYQDVADRSRHFAGRLRDTGIGPDDKVVLWSENRAEWLMVLWGCLLEGVVLVPIDYRSSADLVLRIAEIVDARAIVAGETVGALETTRPVWSIEDAAISDHRVARIPPPVPRTPASAEASAGKPHPGTIAEIIFTSGATADPKGVVLTHRNILANIVPIEREIAKYRKYARPFAPIRFLNLLPLSHMFGQSMATFVPPMLEGVVVFTRSFSPAEVIREVHGRRISVMVCVPKMLEVLRDYVVARHPRLRQGTPRGLHPLRRWWRYRAIHRMFGFKFWAFVVGAAPLDPEVEQFWRDLGFAVVQGYGLTETAPVVTLNHPLRSSHGGVGRPIHGVEVRIADDGEILVRGENVTSGYFNAPAETQSAFKDGWFHTGDIGHVDENGNLRIRGRKKEMIVTPEGLNVFPDDIERVLNELPGVRESAVVGAPVAGGSASAERVQAIVALDPGTDLDAVVRQANDRLQDHQKIRGAARWETGELPRTEGTRKLKRRELRQWLTGQAPGPTATGGPKASVAGILERFAPSRPVSSETSIAELGLSSLERVELMMALEEGFEATVDETQFAAAETVGDLERLVKPIEGAPTPKAVAVESFDFPSWNRSLPARIARRISLPTWILPPMRLFVRLEVRGLEHLREIDGPVVFAANHQSHFDGPAILAALPPKWRYRLAPAMLKEFFAAHFHPDRYSFSQRFTNSLNYYLASLFFAAFPLPQREAGARQALRYIGEVIDQGYSVLIFPEGKRTDEGEIIEFKRGVGMIASRLQVPIVPVRIEGLERILHHRWVVPRPGRARVTFGKAMSLKGNDYAALAAEVERAVRAL